MKKLLLYDLKEQKKILLILAAVYVLIITIIVLVGLRTSDLQDVMTLLELQTIIYIITLVSITTLFDIMFRSRFIKDDLLNYTSISKKTLFWEPILMAAFYIIITSSTSFLITQFCYNDPSLHTQYTYAGLLMPASGNIVFSFLALELLWTSIQMLVWIIMKKKNRCTPTYYAIAEYIALGLCFISGFGAIQYSGDNHLLADTFLIVFSIILFLIAYGIFLYKNES